MGVVANTTQIQKREKWRWLKIEAMDGFTQWNKTSAVNVNRADYEGEN